MCELGRVSKGGLLMETLGRRNISAVFNCPKTYAVSVDSRLCGRSSVQVVLPERRRTLIRRTSTCTEAANGMNIYLIADKPKTAGLIANLTATGCSDMPLMYFANRMTEPLVKGSTFRRISVMKVAHDVAGCNIVMQGERSLKEVVGRTFCVTEAKEPKPMLVSLPGSIVTRLKDTSCPSAIGVHNCGPGAGIRVKRLGHTLGVLGGTGGPLFLTKNNIGVTHTGRIFARIMRGARIPIIAAVVKHNTIPASRPLCVKGLKVRKTCTSGVTIDRYSLLFSVKAHFGSHVANGLRRFTPGTRVIRVSVSATSVSEGVRISIPVITSTLRTIAGVGRCMRRYRAGG